MSKELQRLCLDAHEAVVSLHGILDPMALHQFWKKIHLHGVEVIFAVVEYGKKKYGKKVREKN